MASVLIIHERSDICHVLSPAIESHGHECYSLPSCEEAIQNLRTATFDIVILDIDTTAMPGDAVQALAKSECRPHILIITNGCNPNMLEEAIRAGAWDVICEIGRAHV